MYIEHKGKKIVFIHVGGNAGTSIEWYLHTIDKPQSVHIEKFKDNNHSHIDIIRAEGFPPPGQHEPLKWYNTHDVSFAVVRNPFRRMLAKYFASPHSKDAKNHERAFEEFIVECYEYKTAFAQGQRIHTQCQSVLLEGVDVVLRFETLQEDFNSFCMVHELPIRDLVKCNSTSHPAKNMGLYTMKGVELVHYHNEEVFNKYYGKDKH